MKTTQPPPSILTPREQEVLKHISEGLSARQVAEHLEISIKTVETHRTHIMVKLDIHNIAGLVKYAIRVGITTL